MKEIRIGGLVALSAQEQENIYAGFFISGYILKIIKDVTFVLQLILRYGESFEEGLKEGWSKA